MKVASRVMYTIANFFTWIEVLVCITGIIVIPLMMSGVITNNNGYSNQYLQSAVITLAFVLFFSLILIGMVRIAKSRESSIFWDILFLFLGIITGNIFYMLGGIFGMFSLS